MFARARLKSSAGALSWNSLRIIRSVVSLLLDAALADNGADYPLLASNPARGFKLGTRAERVAAQTATIRVMTYDQISRFLRAAKRACSTRDYTLFHMLSDTGMRPSEALALRWPDLNLRARTVRIERAVTLGRQIKSTKTGRGRTVPLTVPLAKALAIWQRRRYESPEDYVFPLKRTGEPVNIKMPTLIVQGISVSDPLTRTPPRSASQTRPAAPARQPRAPPPGPPAG
jgi:integrase